MIAPARPSGCLPALPALLARPVWSLFRRLSPGPALLAASRGVALRGAVWTGHHDRAFDGVVVVGADGRVAVAGPVGALPLPEDLPVVDCAWVGPGITDAHVRLGGAAPGRSEAGGALVAVRDLGSSPEWLASWRESVPMVVVGSGPPLVGLPARPRPSGATAGAEGEPGVAPPGHLPLAGRVPGDHLQPGQAVVVDGPAAARRVVAQLVAEDIDLLEVRIADAWPGAAGTQGAVDGPGAGRRSGRGPDAGTGGRGPAGVGADGLAAAVEAAHAAGLPVVAHALSAAAVRTALAAGVDELASVPVEPLPGDLVERLAAAEVTVVSTLQRHAAAGPGAARNAAELHRAGVRLVYGTALGGSGFAGTAVNTAVGPDVGVDPRELDRLAYAGLGRLGALRAATAGAALAAGLAGRAPSGRIDVGRRAALVGLYADPLVEPAAWRCPAAVVRGTVLGRG